jgi:hypothetical protein
MNTVFLLLLTGCTPGAGPGWVEVPAAPAAWDGGGGYQAAPSNDGRHGHHLGRRGLFHRKPQQGCGCSRPGASPGHQKPAALPGGAWEQGLPEPQAVMEPYTAPAPYAAAPPAEPAPFPAPAPQPVAAPVPAPAPAATPVAPAPPTVTAEGGNQLKRMPVGEPSTRE